MHDECPSGDELYNFLKNTKFTFFRLSVRISALACREMLPTFVFKRRQAFLLIMVLPGVNQISPLYLLGVSVVTGGNVASRECLCRKENILKTAYCHPLM